MSSKTTGRVHSGNPGTDARLFRSACARFATGITVVTTTDAAGHPHGLTVNSFTSVSLQPPLVLVCIDLRNSIVGHFITSAAYGINILANDQERLSRRFSSAAEDRFAGVDWYRGELQVPLLKGVLATFECAVTQAMEIGDHTVLVGEVRQISYTQGNPLLYFNGGYQALV